MSKSQVLLQDGILFPTLNITSIDRSPVSRVLPLVTFCFLHFSMCRSGQRYRSGRGMTRRWSELPAMN